MTRQELQTFTQESHLSEEDKNMWSSIIETLADEHVSLVGDVLQKDSAMLAALTENIKAKRDALTSGDHTKLDAILEQERARLKNV